MLPGIAGVGGLVGSAKTISYQELKTDTANSSAYTFSAADFGAAETGRVIIATITANGTNAKTVSSVTIGGVSATILRQASNGDWTGAIAAAVVPSGATGDIVVNLSAAASAASVGVYRAGGLSSAAALDTDSNTTLSGLTLTSETNGLAVALCTFSGSGVTVTWSGVTEDFDTSLDDSSNRLSGGSIVTTGSTVLITPTPSGAASSQVFVAATF